MARLRSLRLPFSTISAAGVHLERLQGVKMEARDVVEKIEHQEECNEPVVVVQPPLVDVVLEPHPSGGALHHRDEHRAQVVPEGAGDPEQRGRRAAHALWRLVVQELHVPHRGERVAHAVQRVLRHQPEHADGHDRAGAVEQAVLRGHAAPPGLHERARQDAEDGHREAGAHALEVGDATRPPPRVTARDGDEDAVVESKADEHGQRGEDDHCGRRDLEARGEVAVHGARLLDGEGEVVRRGRDRRDAGCPQRQHADDGFELLHPMHRRYTPEVRLAGVGKVSRRQYSRSVQEPSRGRTINK
uniref:Uncharacterized protein n=1 Tax=Zea mays TaxID=4577 RepID=A0A804Q0S5_MAIZE